MKTSTGKTAPRNVDEYIASFPPDIQEILEEIRTTIRKAAPAAEESISYRIPTLKLNGPLIYYAAHKAHIGLYPMTAGVKERFKKELSTLEGSKGTVRFPLDKPIPYTLISRIVKFRIKGIWKGQRRGSNSGQRDRGRPFRGRSPAAPLRLRVAAAGPSTAFQSCTGTSAAGSGRRIPAR